MDPALTVLSSSLDVSATSDISSGTFTADRTVIASTSNSFEYVHACALSNQSAARHDPMTLVFQAEKLPPAPGEPEIPEAERVSQVGCDIVRARLAALSEDEIQRLIYDSAIARISQKCKSGGAFIAEAGDFAASTCWEPIYAPDPPPDWRSKYGPTLPTSHISKVMENLIYNGTPMSQLAKERPLFSNFWFKSESVKYRYLYPFIWQVAEAKRSASDASDGMNESVQSTFKRDNLKYWYICLTSRNPTVQPPVQGAVRAIIEPFIKRFIEQEDIPAIFIIASNERARNVYGYFGFRVVDTIDVGRDEKGRRIRSWCMVYTKDHQLGVPPGQEHAECT